MNNNTYLVVTSIASQDHPVIKRLAEESTVHNVPFIVIGDTKSPQAFNLEGCDFFSIERQQKLNFKLAEILPTKHYSRKNIGYLVAMLKGAEIIFETDDDNIPFPDFWNNRIEEVVAHHLSDTEWLNIYKYFTDVNIWPRGFALEHLQKILPALKEEVTVKCPIQQGLADENPDVDAIYRLILPLPINFKKRSSIALGNNAFCPFNSQNTTWFKEAFPLMYLPSYCSFRMTDIWRSFVAQRIAWTCGWSVLFHQSTVWQERNDHNLMKDFSDEVEGYTNNNAIYEHLRDLKLKEGVENMAENMILCYQKLIDLNLIGGNEIKLLNAWLADINEF
jgi:hypothetical protein